MQEQALKDLTKRVPFGNNAMRKDTEHDKSKVGRSGWSAPPPRSSSRAPAGSWRWCRTRKYPTTKAQQNAYGYTEVNWNVDTKYQGTTGFQFGSTAKMYAIVAGPRDRHAA